MLLEFAGRVERLVLSREGCGRVFASIERCEGMQPVLRDLKTCVLAAIERRIERCEGMLASSQRRCV